MDLYYTFTKEYPLGCVRRDFVWSLYWWRYLRKQTRLFTDLYFDDTLLTKMLFRYPLSNCHQTLSCLYVEEIRLYVVTMKIVGKGRHKMIFTWVDNWEIGLLKVYLFLFGIHEFRVKSVTWWPPNDGRIPRPQIRHPETCGYQ